jgi:hypothetical protein
MISYCGLKCTSCPIHLATLEQDHSKQISMRESIVKQCLELYGMNLKLEEVTDCDGCKVNDGRLFSGCINCEIRKCAMLKEIENCALCNDYACNLLLKHFKQDPEAKLRLEEIRKTIRN